MQSEFKLNSLSIRQRLGLGLSLIIFTVIILGVLALVEFKKEANLIKNIFHHPYAVSGAVKNIHADIMTIHTLALSMVINNDKDFIEAQRKKIDDLHKEINLDFNIIYERYLGPKTDVQQTFDLYQHTVTLRDKLINLIIDGNLEQAKKFMKTAGNENIESLHHKIHKLSDFADMKANEFFTRAEQKEVNIKNLLIFFVIILILIGGTITLVIIKSITDPLNTLIGISDKINRGDFSVINDNKLTKDSSKDEFGQLFISIHTLLNNLLLPYANIIKSNRSLFEITDEVRRLLDSFDKYIIASKTDTKGKIIYASKAFQEISGYSRDELLGQNQNIVRHPDMQSHFHQDLWQTVKNGESWNGEIKNRKKDGSFFWINTHISPDIDKNGKIIGYNAISEDITVTKAYEELSSSLENRVIKEIQKNNEKTGYIIQQSRLAQMGEMISMIAHQWRQPLSSISAISGTLTLDIIMDNYKEEFFKERLESISALSQHLSNTIDDFRSFFKEDKEELTVDIKSIIDDSISIIGEAVKNRDINLSVKYIDNPTITSRINEIKQVIINIIKNAEDILLEKSIQEARIWIKVFLKNLEVCITIEDNAGGIPKDIIEKIFDPYFSTKKAKDGTGLGLYISKTIIEDHCKGDLKVQNSNIGAKFTISLPLKSKEH